jgi:hypothetical protein
VNVLCTLPEQGFYLLPSFSNVSNPFLAMTNLSLSAYCKARNLPKASVHKFLKAQCFNTTEGMTSDMIAAADAYFLDEPISEPTATAITPTVIEVGNHRGQLALPNTPASIDLGQYRGENAALSSFQPEDIDRFLASCDGFLEAVDADYQHQQAITQRKAAAAQQVRAKVEQVQQASLIYQLRSEQLALHNATLDQALQRDMSILGKPQQPTESPQP